VLRLSLQFPQHLIRVNCLCQLLHLVELHNLLHRNPSFVVCGLLQKCIPRVILIAEVELNLLQGSVQQVLVLVLLKLTFGFLAIVLF
jgi:hypothetical protein